VHHPCWLCHVLPPLLLLLQGDKPPEPDGQALREPDVALGVMEVQQLGLVGLLMQQHGYKPSR
jgi:hypothetical protein